MSSWNTPQFLADTLRYTVPLLGVPAPAASLAALHIYQERHKAIEEAYRQFLDSKEHNFQCKPGIKAGH